MDKISFYQDTIERILHEHAAIPYSYGDIQQHVIINPERTHFLLFNEGWQGEKRIHSIITHVEIRDGKIWLHFDGIEEGITEELVSAGIPKDKIVLAFYPPSMRIHTDYAIA